MFSVVINKEIDINKIGKKFEEQFLEYHNLEKTKNKNYKWDGYGNNGIELQIKLHKKNKDFTLDSYTNYSFMYYNFLLIVGEHNYEDFNIDVINVKLKIYYINCFKWNEYFPNRNINIEIINNINKKINEQNKINNEIINKFYEKFGNFNDKDLFKISYRRRIINRKENSWTLRIKKEKTEEFFNNFKEVNIKKY